MRGVPTGWRSHRFTIPLRPRICWKATAPTKGGITRGSMPSVWRTAFPGNAWRTVRNASGTPTMLPKSRGPARGAWARGTGGRFTRRSGARAGGALLGQALLELLFLLDGNQQPHPLIRQLELELVDPVPGPRG